jgi:hypothetical protein
MESRGFLIVVLDNKSPGSLPHLQALDPGGALPACGPTFAIWRLAAKLNVDVNVRGHSISSWLRAMLARHAVIFSAGMRS